MALQPHAADLSSEPDADPVLIAETRGYIEAVSGGKTIQERPYEGSDAARQRAAWIRGFANACGEPGVIDHVKRSPPRGNAHWTGAEDDFLALVWRGPLRRRLVAELLGRSWRSVRIRASRAGLTGTAVQ